MCGKQLRYDRDFPLLACATMSSPEKIKRHWHEITTDVRFYCREYTKVTQPGKHSEEQHRRCGGIPQRQEAPRANDKTDVPPPCKP